MLLIFAHMPSGTLNLDGDFTVVCFSGGVFCCCRSKYDVSACGEGLEITVHKQHIKQ